MRSKMMKSVMKKVINFLILVGTIALLYEFAFKPKKSMMKLGVDNSKHVVSFKAAPYNHRIYGTGFKLQYEGSNYIVTNAHVCKAGKQLYKGYNDLIQVDNTFRKILKVSSLHDICIIESPFKEGLKLSKQDPKELDEVVLIGHPRGIKLTVRTGHLINSSVYVCIPICFESYQISSLAYPGNSGSPVLNDKGEVIGILFAGSSVYVNEPFVVPLQYIYWALEDLNG